MRALAAEAADTEALIALRRVADSSRYGTVELAGTRIIRFREKAPGVVAPAVNATLLDRISALPCSIELDIFPALAQGGRLAGRVCDAYLLDIGLPETLERGRRELAALRRRPAVFLDRDGVLNLERAYVHRPEQVEWIPGAIECVRRLNDLGYRVVVVTNQAGVAHCYYGEDNVHSLHA
jgi:D-glycero-D-manno-heptose 1,7-bisphosphate phosphatase